MGTITVRVATIHNKDYEDHRIHSTDLVELRSEQGPCYFFRDLRDSSIYLPVGSPDKDRIEARMDSTGAQPLELSPEESGEIQRVVLDERKRRQVSELLSGLVKRTEEAGLKGMED